MEEKHSLDEIYALVKENNRMLKAMRRGAFVGGIVKFVWWVAVLIVIPYVIFIFYLQPYLASIQAAYENINTSAGTVSSAVGDLQKFQDAVPNWQELLKQFQGN